MSSCPICYTNPPTLNLSCNHAFCQTCIEFYLSFNISEGNVFHLRCPECDYQISDNEILACTNPDIYLKYTQFTSIKELLKNPKIKLCPQPDCRGYDEFSPPEGKLVCRSCQYQYCFYCSEAFHKGKCLKAQDRNFQKWKKREKMQLCPRCKAFISKNGGCNRVTCSKCSFEFCWLCSQELNWRHKRVKCLMGSALNNLYWRSIGFLICFPVSFFYLFFWWVWYKMETYDVAWLWMVDYRGSILVVSFLFSPVLTVAVLPVLVGLRAVKAVCNKVEVRYMRSVSVCYFVIGFVFFYVFIDLAILLCYAIFCILLPPAGVCLLIIKCYRSMSYNEHAKFINSES